jgi:hypothetical protein
MNVDHFLKEKLQVSTSVLYSFSVLPGYLHKLNRFKTHYNSNREMVDISCDGAYRPASITPGGPQN